MLHFVEGEIRALKDDYHYHPQIQHVLYGFASKLFELNTMKYLSFGETCKQNAFHLFRNKMRFTSLFDSVQYVLTSTHLMNSIAVDFALILIESLPHLVRKIGF